MSLAALQSWCAGSPQTMGAFAILMQSATFTDAQKQLQSSIWIAGLLAIVIFAMVLFSPKRKLGQQNSTGVDWEREEARLKSLADLKKATRSPDEQQKVVATATSPSARRVDPDPIPPLPPGAIPGFDVVGQGPVATPTATTPLPKPAGDESELDKLLRGLSD